jgi:hypothetical protein
MISKNLPEKTPQKPIGKFYHGSNFHGNIRLGPPKMVTKAKPWKNDKTGETQSPMSHEGMDRLQIAMREQLTSMSTISCLSGHL